MTIEDSTLPGSGSIAPAARRSLRWLHLRLDHGLQRLGVAKTGEGGWGRRDGYGLQLLRLPVPTVTTRGGPLAFEVALDRVTTPCGFSYHPDGWHPYRDTLAELLAEPDLPYERTTLARFYEAFQPETVQEALLEDVDEPVDPVARWPAVLPLFKHLWSLTPRYVDAVLADPDPVRGARQQFGPHSAEFGRRQADRLVRAHESLTRGYRPHEYSDGYLRGYFLVRGDDYRFVAFHGNHRLAAFERLGIDRPLATFKRGHSPVVDADRLGRWVEGRYGVFTREAAELIFDRLFTETGREKADRLGLR